MNYILTREDGHLIIEGTPILTRRVDGRGEDYWECPLCEKEYHYRWWSEPFRHTVGILRCEPCGIAIGRHKHQDRYVVWGAPADKLQFLLSDP